MHRLWLTLHSYDQTLHVKFFELIFLGLSLENFKIFKLPQV